VGFSAGPPKPSAKPMVLGRCRKLSEVQILKEIFDLVTKRGVLGYFSKKFFSDQMETRFKFLHKICSRKSPNERE
jgi:hypothetical protein